MADETQAAMEAAADAGKAAGQSATGAGANFAEQATGQAREQAQRAGEAFKATGEKINEGRSSVGLKMIEQAESNAHEAFAAMRDAARAKDMTEIMRIQAEYLRGQSSRSMVQAREIGEMIARFGRDATASLRPDTTKPG